MTKIKICGIRRYEDVAAINKAMPDYVGFIFAPGRRYVNPDMACQLRMMLDPKIISVGVFVNAELAEVAGIFDSGAISVVQLHGDEEEAYIDKIKILLGCPIIKVVAVGEFFAPELVSKSADYLLFDTLGRKRGGSGIPFDWSLIKGFRQQPFFLAGGMNETNVREAIELLSPYGVDVSSSLESEGFKDAEKIARFVSAVREETPKSKI